MTPQSYRVSYPLLVIFSDATRDLIRPDTVITLDGLPFDEGKMVYVTWGPERGSIFAADLRYRAKLEPELTTMPPFDHRSARIPK